MFFTDVHSVARAPFERLKESEDFATIEACLHANLGVVCRRLGRTTISNWHFMHALEVNAKTQDNSASKRFCALQFNRGMNFLSIGNGREAVSCLTDACISFGHSSAIWLRLAEASIAERARTKASGDTDAAVRARKKFDGIPYNNLLPDLEHGVASLVRASMFARHALRLELEGLKPSCSATEFRRCQHCQSDIAAGAILLLAYIHLELNDVTVALEWAEMLIAWPRCQAATYEMRTLASTYATEARAALSSNLLDCDGDKWG